MIAVLAAQLGMWQLARRPVAIKRRSVIEWIVREQAASKPAASSRIHCNNATAVARVSQQRMQPRHRIPGIDDCQHRRTGGLQDSTKCRVASICAADGDETDLLAGLTCVIGGQLRHGSAERMTNDDAAVDASTTPPGKLGEAAEPFVAALVSGPERLQEPSVATRQQLPAAPNRFQVDCTLAERGGATKVQEQGAIRAQIGTCHCGHGLTLRVVQRSEAYIFGCWWRQRQPVRALDIPAIARKAGAQCKKGQVAIAVDAPRCQVLLWPLAICSGEQSLHAAQILEMPMMRPRRKLGER